VPGNDFHDWPAYKGLKTLTIRALDSVGVFALLRRAHLHDLIVLTYHDVLPGPLDVANPLFGLAVDTGTFRAHMCELRAHYVPVSLVEVLRWLRQGAELPSLAALVTFDDGHRNIRQHALPILREFGIPAVVFVTAGFLGDRYRLTWFEELFAAVMSSAVPTLRLRGREISLGNRESRARLCGQLIDHARQLRPRELDALRDEVLGQLGATTPFALPEERFAWLTVDDCAHLVEGGVTIGAHTLSHPLLRTLDDGAAVREIEGSKKTLEAQLGCRVDGFAYPFGNVGLDFAEREMGMAKAAGFSAAFAASGGLVRRSADPWCLPRIGIGQLDMPGFRFAASGMHDLVRGR
jgi:peptidoglycan/xylan/chitin deacetylase (PgdA/CDA1 family)